MSPARRGAASSGWLRRDAVAQEHLVVDDGGLVAVAERGRTHAHPEVARQELAAGLNGSAEEVRVHLLHDVGVGEEIGAGVTAPQLPVDGDADRNAELVVLEGRAAAGDDVLGVGREWPYAGQAAG